MATSAADANATHWLTPLLPETADPQRVLSGEAAARLQEHRAQLRQLGFELELRRDSLQVRHRDRSFETVIQLSHEDDLGELRRLFQSLKATFGRLTDRFFSWLFQPSAAVTRPYESLREIVSLCQAVRQKFRLPA